MATFDSTEVADHPVALGRGRMILRRRTRVPGPFGEANAMSAVSPSPMWS